MSSIKFPPHPRTLAEIAAQPTNGVSEMRECGCHERGEPGRWWLCSYHLGVDEGWDERQEVINDLNERIDRGLKELDVLGEASRSDTGLIRITGKIEGLLLVKDWLRSYE
jgi:hypothetical protein